MSRRGKAWVTCAISLAVLAAGGYLARRQWLDMGDTVGKPIIYPGGCCGPQPEKEKGWTKLHYAARADNPKYARACLKEGIDPNAPDARRETPLHVAARHGSRKAAAVLLAHGANPDARSESKATPLHCTYEHPKNNIADLLLAHGADVNAVDEVGRTPLITAQEYRCDELIRYLLDHGARVNPLPGDNTSSTALHCVSNAVVAKWLIEAGADVNARTWGCDWDGDTPLHYALDGEIAKVLIAAGANLEAGGQFGWTPLHSQAFVMRPDVIKVLVDAGANLSARDFFGNTALDVARGSVQQGSGGMFFSDKDRTAVIDYLVRHGAPEGFDGTVDAALKKMASRAHGIKDSWAVVKTTTWDSVFEKTGEGWLEVFTWYSCVRVDFLGKKPRGEEGPWRIFIAGPDFYLLASSETRKGERRTMSAVEMAAVRRDRLEASRGFPFVSPLTLFSLRPDDLRKRFDASVAPPPKAGTFKMILTAKDPALKIWGSGVKTVELVVDTETWLPASVRLRVGGEKDDWTLYEVTKVVIDSDILSAAFDAPEGYTIQTIKDAPSLPSPPAPGK